MRLPHPALLVITDRRQVRLPLEDVAEAVFSAGCRWLSLREKDLAPNDRIALLRRLHGIAARWDATFGVHGDIQAATAVPGAALHLPVAAPVAPAREALGQGRLIGRSAHVGHVLGGPDLAALDYVTLSPVFPSASKPGYGPVLRLAGLAAAVRAAAVPIIALGGIQADNIRACLEAGAAGVAVMGEVMRAEDPARVTESLIQRFYSPVGN